ncbi:paired-like homeodomain transcription factor LEUTX isoform 2, partial [Daubentonia madagascariensis]
MHPDWVTIQELASRLHLDESVIKTWFKNQCARWKKQQQQQQQTQPSLSPGASNQTSLVKEEETPLPISAANTHPMSPGISDASYHDPNEPSGIKKPGGTGASVCNSSWDSLPFDIQQICLGDSDPPWASIPCEIDELVLLYNLPGEEDPSTLDQYLFPVCL